jgi:hypothetical protein
MAKKLHSEIIPTGQIYRHIENLMEGYKKQRSSFERRWYDNNFFDDGYHFRFLSRSTGKIVDLSARASQVSPQRSIPKSSRQIRGVASLLLALEPYPVIYPEPVLSNNFQDKQEYVAAMATAKDIAKRTGHWVEEQWDELNIDPRLMQMMILAAKHSVSFMQIWADHDSEDFKAKVFDAFDIYLDGSNDSIYECPSITKATPQLISKIKANDYYDEEERVKLSPDNKYASSEVKQAYMQTRFGFDKDAGKQPTIILKESFVKEYISEENLDRIKYDDKDNNCLEGRNKGDPIIRQTFSTSNGTLKDTYTSLSEYPFVDFRFEPGHIYQVPLIERFIPSNKSLDIAVSRIEGFANTMVTGIYQKRKGENYQISNIPGGQVIEYEATPLQQMNLQNVPSYMFNFIELLNSFIEEQGATTSTLGKLPTGVKSGVAIEAIKATEYANLKIPTDQFKDTVKEITKRLLELGDTYYSEPVDVMRLDSGEPDYFTVIGKIGAEKRQEAGLSTKGMTVLNKDYKVRIEIESGLGYTVEGKKNTMIQIVEYMTKLAEMGMIPQEAVKQMTQKFLEIFQFGSTQEFMDAFEKGEQLPMQDNQLQQMKIALLEVLKDTGAVGEQQQQQSVDATKVGVVEAMRDLNAT